MLFTIYFYIFMFTKISHRMKKIINRKHELNLLQKLYDRDSFAMATIYGLKNIGKTTLINHFTQKLNCRKISFTAVEQNEKVMLSLMKETVLHRLCKIKHRNIRLFTIEDMYQ